MYHLGLTLAISCLTGKTSQTVFNVDRPVEKMVSNQGARIGPFPDLPLANLNNLFTPPPILDQLQNDVIKKITINLGESQRMGKITVRQSLEPEWLFQRSKRLTASNFGKVIKRKRPPTESFLRDIFVAKDLSKVSSIRHGRQQGLIVRTV